MAAGIFAGENFDMVVVDTEAVVVVDTAEHAEGVDIVDSHLGTDPTISVVVPLEVWETSCSVLHSTAAT